MRNFYAPLANSTIQVDVQHITDNCCFHKKKKLSYAELHQEGKQINSPKTESLTRETEDNTKWGCYRFGCN